MNTILIIEDDIILRNLIREVLEEQSFSVVEADNGQEGIEQAQAYQPTLILCDVMMPALDGYSVLKELQNQPKTSDIPFIFLTAKGARDSLRKGMELGADDYLVKPFTIEELLATIQTRLQKQQKNNKVALDKIDELRQSLIASFPHELFTPLHGILGFTQILKISSDTLSPQDIIEISDEIEVSAQRLNHLLQNFMILARLEVARQDSSMQKEAFLTGMTMAVQEIIEAVIHERGNFYDRTQDVARNLTQNLMFDEIVLELGDKWVHKIIFEVIDNAFKFSPANSPLMVTGQVKDQNVILSVCDRGVGMTSEQINNIGAYTQFNRKFHEQQGSGTGLSIVQRLCEIAKGHFSLQSLPNQGTEVTITLPLMNHQ